jgi:hypothetical protein
MSDTNEVIVLIHGIRTFADWQPMVQRVLEELPAVRVIAVKYGYFDVLRFWFPVWTRRLPVEDVRRTLEDVRAKYPDARLSVVAHSFGTYAISQILRDNSSLRLYRLVLCGSIIERRYRWSHVRAQIDTDIINDYGTRDIWPVLAQSLSWGYGDTGRHRFGGPFVRDRGHDFAHSDFFDESFVRAFWQPWFDKGKFVPGIEGKARSPWWLAVLAFLPVKTLVACAVVAVALGLLPWPGWKPPPDPVNVEFSEPMGLNQADVDLRRRATGFEFGYYLDEITDLIESGAPESGSETIPTADGWYFRSEPLGRQVNAPTVTVEGLPTEIPAKVHVYIFPPKGQGQPLHEDSAVTEPNLSFRFEGDIVASGSLVCVLYVIEGPQAAPDGNLLTVRLSE